VYKLGQKEAPAPPDFSRTTITTIYLSRAEYDVFAPLPSHELQKRRYRIEEDGRVFSVDVFEGALTGLILAEVTFEAAEEMARQWQLPSWVLREVSDDVRFTGGALAALAIGEVAELIRSQISSSATPSASSAAVSDG
jgi:CYTH domain-containing protein